MILAAAEKVGDPGAPRLANALTAFGERQREFVAFGRLGSFLDRSFNLKETPAGPRARRSDVFHHRRRADSLRRYLAKRALPGVQAVCNAGDHRMVRFNAGEPARRAALDSVILLTALLYQASTFAHRSSVRSSGSPMTRCKPISWVTRMDLPRHPGSGTAAQLDPAW